MLDETITPMGGRFLEDMLRHPWRDAAPIRRIQQCVIFLHDNDSIRNALRKSLEAVYDLERLIMRICLNRASPRDYLALRQGVSALPGIKSAIVATETPVPDILARTLAQMDDLGDLASLLESALVENVDAINGECGVFRLGYNAALDEQIDLMGHGEQKLQDLLQKERAETGIAKLKLGYNRVFGYYFETPRSSVGQQMPEHFIRRQSLANAERFSTQALKQLEENLLLAEGRRRQLETEMLENLRVHLADQKERILQTGDIVAQLDYWQSLAEAGRRNGWILPELTDESEIHIHGGRHPVVETIIGRTNFVPNDFHMDQGRRFCLLTGPNMAGKSTVLRQVALICLMAQMGSMVPAQSARIGLVDRIFSRVGAADNLAQGQSTFMVEMMETARILRQASRRSLIILDEIGRGTSTFDGMALAWAIVEDLAARGQGRLRTIFATHYHELTALEGKIPGLFTMNIAVGSFDNNEIIFLHRLLPGPADKSYGIEVARIAGIPYPVVQRARDILKSLEGQPDRTVRKNLTLPGLSLAQDASRNATPLLSALQKLDVAALNAENALMILMEWKDRWGTPKK